MNKIKKTILNILPWYDISKKIYHKYSLSKYFFDHGIKSLSYFVNYRIYRKFGCIISPKAIIKESINFPHPIGIVIGEGVIIGKNVTIYQNVTLGRKNKDIAEYPIVGDNVTIYCNSTIIGNVKIGNNAVIGCNSVILRDVKDGEVVFGIVK